MKVDLIRKFRWYIVGFILVAIMLSVSLSFCTWDSLSLQAKMNAKGGGYAEIYSLNQDFKTKGLIDVGDTVYFGKFYQTIEGNILTPLEWRVIDIDTAGNYVLMTENVIANGAYYGDKFYVKGDTVDHGYPFCQDYSKSTVRAWLNNTDRYDGGMSFNSNANTPRNIFYGFYSQAFNEYENAVIIPRTISGMFGYGLLQNLITDDIVLREYEALSNEKVWLASAWELGITQVFGNLIKEKNNDKQFSYFINGGTKVAYTTAFTTSTLSNFTHINATYLLNNTMSSKNIKEGEIVAGNYWLRSPSPRANNEGVAYMPDDSVDDYLSCRSFVGVRPCVIVKAK